MTEKCDKCGEESENLKTVIEGTRRQRQCPECRNVQVVRVEVQMEIDGDVEKPVEKCHHYVMDKLKEAQNNGYYDKIENVKHKRSVGVEN